MMLRHAILLTSTLLLPLLAQAQPANDPQALIAKGEYLAIAGDCAACHTAPGGQPFAGGLAIATPLGEIFATNISPSRTHGIGAYTFEDFDRATRRGIRKDGAHLYPAMPYTAYAKVTETDMRALYAYFMQGIEPIDEAAPETRLPFPFSIRLSMLGWNLLFASSKPYQPDPSQSEVWNRGAYLAEGLAHCSTCHTPRNFLMAEKGGQALAGASLGTWFAPNITSDSRAGIGSWSAEELAAYLSTGHSGNGSQAGGPMLEAIDLSFSRLTDADIQALVTYVRSVPASSLNAPPGQWPAQAPQLTDFDLMRGTAPAGAQLYSKHCATCHQPSGEGSNGLPALFGNAALSHRPNADNLVMAILDGLAPHHRQVMPGFRKEMNDEQVATLTNYLFTTLGDAGIQTHAQRVAELRQGGAASPLLKMAQIGIWVAGCLLLVLVVLIGWWLKRRRV